MDTALRNYVSEQFKRFPTSTHDFPTAPFRGGVYFEGKAARELVLRIDQSAEERFQLYKKGCEAVLNERIVSPVDLEKVKNEYKEWGKAIGNEAGPLAGMTAGAGLGAGVAYLALKQCNPSAILMATMLAHGVLLGRADSWVQFLSACSLPVFLLNNSPVLGLGSAGALISTCTELPSRICEATGGFLGELVGQIMATLYWPIMATLYPPIEPPCLKNWKITVCQTESIGLSEDLKSLKEMFNANKAKISKSDSDKLEIILKTIELRIEVIDKLHEELTK